MKRARLVPARQLPELSGVLPPWPGEAVTLDGTVTYVRRTPATNPDAEPALYVHGLGGSGTNWTDLAYLLSGRLDGEAIDLPGFGRSDPATNYSVGAIADRVVRWIEHSGRGPVHLFGNSLGGAVTVRVAGTRPDLVRTLTLISPAMPFMDPRRSVQARLLPLLLIPRAERLAARRLATIAPEDLAKQVIDACFADPSVLPPERIAEAVEEVRRRYETPWYVDAYIRTLRGLVGSFLRSYLPGRDSMWRIAERITAPTLVVTGRQDRLVDVRVAPAVARLIPDSRLLVLDQVGHVAQMERPDLVARAVLTMLDEAAQRDIPAQKGVPAQQDGSRQVGVPLPTGVSASIVRPSAAPDDTATPAPSARAAT
ncbi:MAG: alpha/beta hydrolase [Micromonosporaceae bacterium]|nr:alpha/beta hydrolase [Micromonosporaceae bacterium]